jgi:hypothetical protein
MQYVSIQMEPGIRPEKNILARDSTRKKYLDLVVGIVVYSTNH